MNSKNTSIFFNKDILIKLMQWSWVGRGGFRVVIDRFLLIFDKYETRQIPAFYSRMLKPAASVASMLEAAINQFNAKWLHHPTETCCIILLLV